MKKTRQPSCGLNFTNMYNSGLPDGICENNMRITSIYSRQQKNRMRRLISGDTRLLRPYTVIIRNAKIWNIISFLAFFKRSTSIKDLIYPAVL